MCVCAHVCVIIAIMHGCGLVVVQKPLGWHLWKNLQNGLIPSVCRAGPGLKQHWGQVSEHRRGVSMVHNGSFDAASNNINPRESVCVCVCILSILTHFTRNWGIFNNCEKLTDSSFYNFAASTVWCFTTPPPHHHRIVSRTPPLCSTMMKYIKRYRSSDLVLETIIFLHISLSLSLFLSLSLSLSLSMCTVPLHSGAMHHRAAAIGRTGPRRERERESASNMILVTTNGTN